MNYYQNLSLVDLSKKIDGKIVFEEWKPVIGFERYYLVSSFGRVKIIGRTILYKCGKKINHKTKIRKQSISDNGYLTITFNVSGKSLTIKTHILVAKTFLQNVCNKKTVNHKSGDKTDNSIFNLEWATYSENLKHSYSVLKRLPNKGSRHASSKKVFCLNNSKTYNAVREASRELNSDHGSISKVCNGILNSINGLKFRWA
jgi:hypothetical protein